MYIYDILQITEDFKIRLEEIKSKFSSDRLINQGLFLMSSAIFEDSIRGIIRRILISFPEKLNKKEYKISREEVCKISRKGFEVIIDSSLFYIFKDGVKNQLKYLFKIICNYKESNSEDIDHIIQKCEEISQIRNYLVHNGGKLPLKIIGSMGNGNKAYQSINLDKSQLNEYLDDYLFLFDLIETELKKKFSNYKKPVSKIQRLRELWDDCFESPLLNFDEYWDYDTSKDILTNAKFLDCEVSLSSSEKVLLSIWRHQFNDIYNTEEFIVLSLDDNTISKINKMYLMFNKVKLYHMHQRANPIDFDL